MPKKIRLEMPSSVEQSGSLVLEMSTADPNNSDISVMIKDASGADKVTTAVDAFDLLMAIDAIRAYFPYM
ncbi:MAG: hypothetical protein ACTSPB_01200 [Candidatus Thorarchaeota archaeon]